MGIVTDYNRGEGVILDLQEPAARENAGGDAGQAVTKVGRLPGLFYLAFSPDGKWVAGGAWKGNGVSVWDAASGKTVADLPVEGSARA